MAKAKPFKPFNLNDLDIYKDGSISQEDVDQLIPFGDYSSNLYDSPGEILKETQKKNIRTYLKWIQIPLQGLKKR